MWRHHDGSLYQCRGMATDSAKSHETRDSGYSRAACVARVLSSLNPRLAVVCGNTALGSLRNRVSAGHVSRSWMLRVLTLALPLLLVSSIAVGQMRSVPREEHYDAFRPYVNGDFAEAAREFRSTPYFKSTEGIWIDSIAYHTMIGECLYHMGNLDGALQQYNRALEVFLQFPTWLTRIRIPNALEPSPRAGRHGPTWGGSSRAVRVARIPDRMGMMMGNTDEQNMRAMEQGGVVRSRYMLMVDAAEIVRCTALAIRRRAEILGPAGQYDGLTSELITQLSRRPAPPGSWAQAWVGVQLGMAYACKGKTKEAVAELKSSLVVGGMDHNLTPMALLELGKLAFQAEEYAAAGTFFFEATHSAAMMVDDDITQYEIVAEAFRWGMISHLLTAPGTVSQPLAAAVEWAHRERTPFVQASLLLSAAENAAAINNPSLAMTHLNNASQVMRRRECINGELGGRLQFITAQASFEAGDSNRGRAALTSALAFQTRASRRMFQIRYAVGLDTSGSISSRQAGLLYADVLRDPTPHDWAEDPLESLAVLTIPHVPAYERWMLLSLERNENDKVLGISEALRRHRFYNTLPLGGRLINLRWALQAPTKLLPENLALQRQDLLNRYPALAKLSRDIGQRQAKLASLPEGGDDPEVVKQRTNLQKQILQASTSMERILRAVALSREPSETIFPPNVDATIAQQRLTPEQRIVVYVSTRAGTFAFMLGPEKYTSWKLRSAPKIKGHISKLLREMGLYKRNQPLGLKELTSDAWKETSAELLKELTADAPAEAWDEFDELIVVPDGSLWYVPFEALQIQNEDESVAVIDKVRVRYAPTISLAVPDERPRPRVTRTAVVTGELFPGEGEELSDELLQNLKADDPNVFEISVKPPLATPVLAKTIGRLVVLNDLDNEAGGPYGWAPMNVAHGKAAGTLGQWMESPWGGPDQVVLPGFHSAAENALKNGGTGQEIFLAVCGLMATGTRTVLLSRWRDGGPTSFELMREFVRELPYRPASEAWQRSVRLATSDDLAWSQEPRVKDLPSDTPPIKNQHPFFWAGYALIDTGVVPK